MSTYPTREEIARAIYDADATLYPNPLLASDESMNPLGETWEESEQDERDAYFANADAILALFPPIETIEAAVRARYPTREVIAAWIEGDDSANYWLSEADDILALFP